MIVVPANQIIGKKVVKTIGLVQGNTIRCSHMGSDILATIKNLFGGEIQEYTKLMAEAREQALDRMVEMAKGLGANAILDVKFATSEIMNQAAEILVYGTAVIIEDARDD